MKKEYEMPKAEKLEFNYSEAVVASSTACDWYMTMTQKQEGCQTVGPIKQWHPDTNT